MIQRIGGVTLRWLFCVILAVCSTAGAKVINVGPSDNYSKIEGAQPGDQVIIAPGTYAFRVYLTAQATPTNPIVIQAQDPANPPVWDFGTNLVDNAPGDYTAGDRARGAWQFSGAQNYSISGIVFRHCRNAARNCGAIRYYETTTNLYIKDCVFNLNDNGMTGGTQDSQATVEFCEFNANGNTNASTSAPTHNIYIYGGYFAMRYCFVHDSVQGQNFHIRCRNATLEYNWFARAANYEGDLMVDDDFSGNGPFQQSLTFRGNVIVQNAVPGNHSQVIALYNDTGLSGLTLSLRALYNTFVGNGGSSAFVHVSNADGTAMTAEISDNIISGTTVATLIEDAADASVNGVNNWQPSNAETSPLANSLRSASPGFGNPAGEDYHLASGSACIGAAITSVYGLAGKEYYLNETTNRMWRPRPSALDIGAFESGTGGSGIGPYDSPPRPQINITPSSNRSVMLSWPLFAQDFQLEQSDLGAPITWSVSPLTITTNGIGLTSTAAAASGQAYYRLHK